jgi:4-coumarate--CoA ligase
MFGKNFTLDILLNAVKKAQPKVLMLGAHHYVQLSEYDIFKTVTKDDIACVTKIFPAGSAVPAICETKLKAMFHNLENVYNGYGQTESGLISIGDENHHLGDLHSAAQVKVVDPDTGVICKAGEVGELCLIGTSMMIGYLERPEDNANYFDSEGFGRSGDIGYYDEDGKIYYVDRMKELIKYVSKFEMRFLLCFIF